MRSLSFLILLFALGCSSSGKNNLDKTSDLVELVLKNYEADFKYCLDDKKNNEYKADFVILPSGMVYNAKITGSASIEQIKCMETILNRILFPPVRDRKAKTISRDLVFEFKKE